MAQAFPESEAAHDGGYTRAQGPQVAGDVIPLMGDAMSTKLNYDMNNKASRDWVDSFMKKPPAASIIKFPEGKAKSPVGDPGN